VDLNDFSEAASSILETIFDFFSWGLLSIV
jgi:hypothetical protein